MRTSGFILFIAALTSGGQASPASSQTSAADCAECLQPGISRLTKSALVYQPPRLQEPAATLVLFHGAGDTSERFLKEFTRFADERNILLLALKSSAISWPRRSKDVSRGPDAENFDAALEELSAKASVDRTRIVLLGFSDGASHALSFGLARPKTFRAIVAMSPGYAFAPRRPDLTQPIFIAHGRRDTVLPAPNVREMIRGLEGAGYRPEVRWFNGGHRIDPDLLNAALDFALGKAR